MPSSGVVRSPGGYQNVSLQIGPPVKYEDSGRYICLVNNPEGHAHKEMFLKIKRDQDWTIEESYTGM